MDLLEPLRRMNAQAFLLMLLAAAVIPCSFAFGSRQMQPSGHVRSHGIRMTTRQSMPLWKKEIIFFLAKGRELRKCKPQPNIDGRLCTPRRRRPQELEVSAQATGRADRTSGSVALISTCIMVLQVLSMIMAIGIVLLKAQLSSLAKTRGIFS